MVLKSCEMDPVESRAVIKYLYLKGHTPKDAFKEMKQVYGKDGPSYDVVKHWHRQFRCGRKSVATAPIPGRPRSVIDEQTIQQVEAAILENPGVTVRHLAQSVSISVGSVEKIIHEHLLLHKVSDSWVPRPFVEKD